MNILLLGLGLGQAELTQLIVHGTALPHTGIACKCLPEPQGDSALLSPCCLGSALPEIGQGTKS